MKAGYNFPMTVGSAGKCPLEANRVFDTLKQLEEYIQNNSDDYDHTACPGILCTIIGLDDDGSDNRGVYEIVQNYYISSDGDIIMWNNESVKTHKEEYSGINGKSYKKAYSEQGELWYLRVVSTAADDFGQIMSRLTAIENLLGNTKITA